MVKREGRDVNRVLVENFVSLQKVMTNLSLKFDSLAAQISKLLQLFEISAKTLAEKGPQSVSGHGSTDNRELIGKIDNLLEQNRVIARGLTLMHEMNSPQPMEEYEAPQRVQMPPVNIPRKVMRPSNPMQQPPRRQLRTDGYQRSISDSKNEPNKKP